MQIQPILNRQSCTWLRLLSRVDKTIRLSIFAHLYVFAICQINIHTAFLFLSNYSLGGLFAVTGVALFISFGIVLFRLLSLLLCLGLVCNMVDDLGVLLVEDPQQHGFAVVLVNHKVRAARVSPEREDHTERNALFLVL